MDQNRFYVIAQPYWANTQSCSTALRLYLSIVWLQEVLRITDKPLMWCIQKVYVQNKTRFVQRSLQTENTSIALWQFKNSFSSKASGRGNSDTSARTSQLLQHVAMNVEQFSLSYLIFLYTVPHVAKRWGNIYMHHCTQIQSTFISPEDLVKQDW